jgi:lysophospholipase L1-like esterase
MAGIALVGDGAVLTHADRVGPALRAAPRSASVAARTVRLVGLGDSVPAGTGCGCASYIDRVGRALARAQRSPVAVVNQAHPGQTSQELLEQVRRRHTRIGAGEVAVVTVGANDFDERSLGQSGCRADDLSCYAGPLHALRHNMDALLSALRPVGGPAGRVVVTDYWNVFLDGQVGAGHGKAYERDSSALTRSVDKVLLDAAKQADVTFVDLLGPFKALPDGDDTPLLAADGDHPSEAGHAMIATLLQQALGLSETVAGPARTAR